MGDEQCPESVDELIEQLHVKYTVYPDGFLLHYQTPTAIGDLLAHRHTHPEFQRIYNEYYRRQNKAAIIRDEIRRKYKLSDCSPALEYSNVHFLIASVGSIIRQDGPEDVKKLTEMAEYLIQSYDRSISAEIPEIAIATRAAYEVSMTPANTNPIDSISVTRTRNVAYSLLTQVIETENKLFKYI